MAFTPKTWQNGQAGGTPLNAVGLNDLETRIDTGLASVERGTVFPEAYGAVGDGSTDDTAALQAAVNAWASAQNGRLHLKPTSSYKVTATIDIKPQSGTSFRGQITANGATPITWAGGNGTDGTRKPVFRVQGLKRSRIEAVNISIPASTTYVHGWELDDTTGTYTSLSQLTFAGCHVFGSTGNTGCGGWRIGHADSTGNADFSFIQWENCGTAFGTSAPTGSFHILQEGANALNNVIVGGYAYYCDSAISNRSSTGAVSAAGNGSIFAYGFGTSHCNIDWDIANHGTYVIHGGRYEVGKRFLNVNLAGSTAGADVVMTGLTLAAYVPADGIIFYADGGTGLHMQGMEVRPAAADADYTAAMITLAGSSAQRGFLSIVGGRFRVADPFLTISGAAAWNLDIRGARYMDSTFHITSAFRNYMSVMSTDTSDVLSMAITGGSVGGAPQIGWQPSSPAIAATVRGRVGYDGGNGLVLDGGTSRSASLKANGVTQTTATSDGRTKTLGGVQRKRTVPGAFPYTALITDHYIAVSTGTAKTVNLPAASTVGAGHEFIIKDTSGGGATNNITVTPNGADTIDGAASKAVTTNYGRIQLVSNGSNGWEVVTTQ